MIKKILKLVGKILTLAGIAFIGVLVYCINPWYIPAIFKRNYPDWFAAHPFISSLISVD